MQVPFANILNMSFKEKFKIYILCVVNKQNNISVQSFRNFSVKASTLHSKVKMRGTDRYTNNVHYILPKKKIFYVNTSTTFWYKKYLIMFDQNTKNFNKQNYKQPFFFFLSLFYFIYFNLFYFILFYFVLSQYSKTSAGKVKGEIQGYFYYHFCCQRLLLENSRFIF